MNLLGLLQLPLYQNLILSINIDYTYEYYNLTIDIFLNYVYLGVFSQSFMADTNFMAFAMWSGITAVLMIITGLVYKIYQRKNS